MQYKLRLYKQIFNNLFIPLIKTIMQVYWYVTCPTISLGTQNVCILGLSKILSRSGDEDRNLNG